MLGGVSGVAASAASAAGVASAAGATSISAPRPVALGVALGSGSMHGYAHVGVIRALQRRGVTPAVITGTSAGAIAGALWAYGLPWHRIHEAVMDLSWWQAPTLRALQSGLMRNRAIESMIDRQTARRPIEAWPIRFAAVATDMRTGERVLLDRGASGPAVAASTSLPVMYAPVRIGERDLVDGALVEPVPVRAAHALGATHVLAVDVAYRPHEAPVRWVWDAAFQSLHILVNRLIDEQIVEADLALRLELHRHVDGERPFDALIDAGDQAVESNWPSIAALLGR